MADERNNSLSSQAMELLEIGIEAIEKQKSATTDLPAVVNNHNLDIPKIKDILYSILETGGGVVKENNSLLAEQLQNVSLTKSLTKDRPINIFQIQNIVFTQVAIKITQILRILDDGEGYENLSR